MFHLIGFIVFGFIVGLIARALTPGHRHMGLLVTTMLGIVGSLLAGWLGQAFGWYGPDQGAGFIMSTIGAVVVLFAYHRIVLGMNRRRGITDSSSNRDFPRKVA